jgi:ADP-ribosyl-[dinitrogen reductase] hydrolase
MMSEMTREAVARTPLAGSLVADAISMPVHWYYDREALRRDYGTIDGYQTPLSPHPDSILWRSHYEAANPSGDILRDQARYWGQRGVHYHQNLKAGENTLNARLALSLAALILEERGYDADRWLERYIHFMLMPGCNADTYVEEYHRIFFTNYAAGKKPRKCGGRDIHIGGLTPVPAIVEAMTLLGGSLTEIRRVVQEHVSLTHKDDGVLRAADALARILVRTMAGEDLRDVMLDDAADWISRAKTADWDRSPDQVVIGRVLSPACYIPDAFPAALFLAWRYARDFRGGVCSNAQVGGDNCHRGAVVGSLLAVAAGIPEDLLDGLAAAPRLSELRVSVPAPGSP